MQRTIIPLANEEGMWERGEFYGNDPGAVTSKYIFDSFQIFSKTMLMNRSST